MAKVRTKTGPNKTTASKAKPAAGKKATARKAKPVAQAKARPSRKK